MKIIHTMLCASASSESFLSPRGGEEKEGTARRAFTATSSTNYVTGYTSTTSFPFQENKNVIRGHPLVLRMRRRVCVHCVLCNRIRGTMFPCLLRGHLIPLTQAGSAGQPQGHPCAVFIGRMARKTGRAGSLCNLVNRSQVDSRNS